LPNILIELQQRIPDLPIRIEICMNIQEVIKGLLEHRYDLGFIHGNNSSPLILQHGVFTEDLIWVASKDFADKHPDIKEQDIGTLPIINYTSSTVFRELFEQELENKCIRSFIEYSDSAAIKHAVIRGLGVSYLPRVLVEEEINSGKLIMLDQGRSLEFRISLVHQRDKIFNMPAYALLLILANTPGVDETIKELL
jgi:DNA-binding transcriptional LysR family regulator